MDWLKDKKNQPVIALILGVVIVVAAVVVYMTMFRGGGESPDSATTADAGAVSPGGPTTGPGPGPVAPAQPSAAAPSMPSAGAATAGAATTAAAPRAVGRAGARGVEVTAQPMETWRPDPFLPEGYKPPKKGLKPKPRITDFPFIAFPAPPRPNVIADTYETPQPVRRMAGVLLNHRVYAIIESNGHSEIVKPGDTLEDRLAMVERIEPDKVILKTVDKHPKYLTVRMASSPTQASASSSSVTTPEVPSPYPGPGGRRRSFRGPMPMPTGPAAPPM